MNGRKVAVVEQCGDCPHVLMTTVGRGDESRTAWFCLHSGKRCGYEVQWDEIPAWCPLSDAEDEQCETT